MLLADVPFIPKLFLQYQQEETAAKSSFIRSGVMATNAEIQARFREGGKLCDLPFFNDLSGNSQPLTDTTPLSINDLGGDLQTAVRLMRGNVWRESDIAAELSGADPMQAIARATGRYWVREYQRYLVALADTMFKTGGPLLATHDSGGIHTESTGDALVDGIAKLGDAGSTLTGVAMHSAVYYKLLKDDVFDKTTKQANAGIIRASGEMLEVDSYLGRPVFVDDTLPAVPATGGPGTDTDRPVYSTFLFGPGAFAYAEAPARVPVEPDRDSLTGVNILINRTHFTIHPNGMRWGGVFTGPSPTDAEFETATNWTKVFTDDKNIKFVRVRTYV